MPNPSPKKLKNIFLLLNVNVFNRQKSPKSCKIFDAPHSIHVHVESMLIEYLVLKLCMKLYRYPNNLTSLIFPGFFGEEFLVVE